MACVDYEKTQRGDSDLEMRLASVNRIINTFVTPHNRPNISVLDGKVTTTLSLIFSFHPFIVSLLPLTHTSCSCSEMVRVFRVLSPSVLCICFHTERFR